MPVVVTALHFIEAEGVGIVAGHGQRAALAVQGDPARQWGCDGDGGVAGQLVEELGDVVGVDEQLLHLVDGGGAIEVMVSTLCGRGLPGTLAICYVRATVRKRGQPTANRVWSDMVPDISSGSLRAVKRAYSSARSAVRHKLN